MSVEVKIPAIEAMRKDERRADRMLRTMMVGVSTRHHEAVLPEMVETLGVCVDVNR